MMWFQTSHENTILLMSLMHRPLFLRALCQVSTWFWFALTALPKLQSTSTHWSAVSLSISCTHSFSVSSHHSILTTDLTVAIPPPNLIRYASRAH
ncbi:hypothetical protein Ae201684P_016721 [Aphanomyces euteiches]|uniref:Uncharacterized protein n=1 Tax=Aphanomyces euteiches TaxID=100861 RepID=A0A6G0XIZ6_9STRA|nr:hypothetical protein Ae201684_004381 [Aphanomyces euteiches]KAH9094106.1 hypothetical protein Ae201684P_016721 [Aphanomyces euteiches]